jgi:hypothetical protein
MNNSDLPARLGTLITSRTAAWVTQSQAIQWRPDAWKRHWRQSKLPGSHVLDELETEYLRQRTIRRSFILDTYQDRPAIELLVATRAWGSGPDNRGPAQASRILTQPHAAAKIEDTVSTARTDGAAAAYSAYYARNKLEGLGVAFVTKLLYFAAYCSPHRPRPLIYDSLVAAAAARFPTAPLLPAMPSSLTTTGYQRYCTWAEDLAEQQQTEPAAIEWSLFTLGADILNQLRK